MEFKLIKLTTTNEIEVIDRNDQYVDFHELRALCGCDTIQIVGASAYPQCLMCIDDEGKIFHKDVNLLASILYSNPYDFIVGDVVVGTRISPNPYDEPDLFCMCSADADVIVNALNEIKKDPLFPINGVGSDKS